MASRAKTKNKIPKICEKKQIFFRALWWQNNINKSEPDWKVKQNCFLESQNPSIRSQVITKLWFLGENCHSFEFLDYLSSLWLICNPDPKTWIINIVLHSMAVKMSHVATLVDHILGHRSLECYRILVFCNVFKLLNFLSSLWLICNAYPITWIVNIVFHCMVVKMSHFATLVDCNFCHRNKKCLKSRTFTEKNPKFCNTLGSCGKEYGPPELQHDSF